ncbi:MAG: NUDIX domain-containing protein [Candidatus Paceibacterota bacterium]|jgi:dATP pyrophosphohydrolase
MRAPLQVIVFPFIKEGAGYLYAIFKRKDMDIWQAIAGGAEDEESPLEAAKREANEEAAIDYNSSFLRLSALATIPAVNIGGLKWGTEIVMIPEIAFGVEMLTKDFQISHEHTEFGWFSCEEAMEKLRYDSNKSALWELDYRLKNGFAGVENNIDEVIKSC